MPITKLATGATAWPSILNSWLDQDSYTPVFVAGTNIAATPTNPGPAWRYVRVGDVVMLFGTVSVNATGAGASVFTVSLPTTVGIAPTANFANIYRAWGNAVSLDGQVLEFESTTGSKLLTVNYAALAGGAVEFRVQAAYLVA